MDDVGRLPPSVKSLIVGAGIATKPEVKSFFLSAIDPEERPLALSMKFGDFMAKLRTGAYRGEVMPRG